MSKHLVIFDFDGTLGDTRRNIVLTMQQTMQALRLSVASEQQCASTIGLPLRECFVRLCPGLAGEQLEQCVETYRRIFDENKRRFKPQPFPGVVETLRELHRRGLTLSVASSRSSASLRELLADMQISDCVSYIVGAEEVTYAKPDPEPVLLTLRALHFEAADALVVGDMPVDIQMGSRAGAATCGVSYGNASREELIEAGADHVIDRFPQLLDLL